MFEDVKIQGLGLRSFVHACHVAEQVVALASRLRIIIILREETPFLYYIEKSGPFSPRHAICLKVKMNGGTERERERERRQYDSPLSSIIRDTWLQKAACSTVGTYHLVLFFLV
jgi:hypothetical protein